MPDTFTPNYNLSRPEINGSRDTWGGKHNDNFTKIDAALKYISDVAAGKAARLTTDVSGVGFLSADPARPVIQFVGSGSSIVNVELARKADLVSSFIRGMIILWVGDVNTVPAGWALCNGQNGSPDLRDRFVRGAGGVLPVIGTGGTVNHSHTINVNGTTLSVAQMPTHSHAIFDPGHSHTVTSKDIGSERPSNTYQLANTTYFGSLLLETRTNVSGTGIAIENSGGNQPHSHSADMATVSHIPPFMTLCYIMKL